MKKFIFLILSVLFFSACQSNHSTTEKVSGPPTALSHSMQGLKEGLTRLLPLVVDVRQYNNPDNQPQIDQLVSELYVTSKQVVHNPAVTNMDPSLRFISTAFTDDLKRADESLKLGKREYARYTMLNMTAYCIECHTRTSSGPSFDSPQLEKTLTALKPLERAEYLLAVRQYDPAFKEFESVIKEGLNDGAHFFELEKAVRYALSIAVKFKQDPKKAQELVSLIEKSSKVPYYLKQNARSWSDAIKAWSKEKPKAKRTVQEQLRSAQNLVKKGNEARVGRSDRAGDIYFLRALSELHLVLAQQLGREQLGEALYLTGFSYESVHDLSASSLHENYYENCVRRVPHSAWSERCYKKLEESIYFGYTGSSGLRVPLDVQTQLQELQKQALPEAIRLKQ